MNADHNAARNIPAGSWLPARHGALVLAGWVEDVETLGRLRKLGAGTVAEERRQNPNRPESWLRARPRPPPPIGQASLGPRGVDAGPQAAGEESGDSVRKSAGGLPGGPRCQRGEPEECTGCDPRSRRDFHSALERCLVIQGWKKSPLYRQLVNAIRSLRPGRQRRRGSISRAARSTRSRPGSRSRDRRRCRFPT
jgi:hypothetical protein